ncbi:hypothetical protein [Limnohabitans sp. MMS-10A-192]|uniref:hypothetical protein n=1 Tax=Limnohabitans sp. MMS-10A-192 TaxID=1835769 RepID=UPI0011B28E5B|nr:hypothetical protein [Limnohabitans sp. MMS-10A-192]
MHPLQKDGDIGRSKLASFNPCLQTLQDSWQKVGKLGALVITNLKPIRIQLCRFDMEELFGLTDGRCLVRGLQALCVGPSLKKTSHLPIPTGHGQEDAKL